MRLESMAKALQEQMESDKYDKFSFLDRLGLLVDREMMNRDNKRLQSRLKKARLHDNASIEDIDFRVPRGLDKELILSLSSCKWIRDHSNFIIMGPTGVGKTYIADALAHQACREGYSAYNICISTMLDELAIAKADGR